MLGAEVCQASKVFLSLTQELSKSLRWPRMFRNVWSISTCFCIHDMFFPSSFSGKNVFYSTLQYMLPMPFSSNVIFLCLFLISKQAKLSLDWISVISLDRKQTYHSFKQITADNGKKLHRKKIQKFTYALSQGKWESVTSSDDWSEKSTPKQ